MLFNSYAFLLVYLPVVLLVYQLASRLHRNGVVIWLGIASLAFYAYWHPAFLIVLGASILINFLFSNLISRTIPNKISTSALLWTAIACNLGALCWYKYLFPLLNFANSQLHTGHSWKGVLLPLGISFFTFTQIAYLVDLQQRAAVQQDFFSYLLFVSFFPHLIAGPILHHKDIMPQFQRNREYGLQINDLAVGFSWFIMGMFKKVILADHLSPTADTVFAAHGLVTPSTAWIGVLSYALQLYFDFSGYCDMANGLARMFSIDFPLNFASPYKATSIVEFWQRWHMTLTQYIGSYLYSPIQFWVSARRQEKGKKVSRKAQATLEGFTQMILCPTILTMFIAGIWHGAGLQFLIFGVLHGVYLSVNHAWRNIRHKRGIEPFTGISGVVTRLASVLLTFGCVVLAQVFFRASSVGEAMVLLKRMIFVPITSPATLATPDNLRLALSMLAIGFVIIWAFPNTQQILARYKPALQLAPSDEKPRWLPIFWKPNLGWALILSAVLLVAIVEMQKPSSFLYFQF